MHQLRTYFAHGHLPTTLKQISRPFGELAEFIDNSLVDSAEKTVALRKLLESKDCAVRAALPPGVPTIPKNGHVILKQD